MINFDYDNEPGKYRCKNQEDEQVEALVSIITPYYNSGIYFEQTFNSVMNQTFKTFEWIIVNDGSTNIEDIEILHRLANTDQRVIIYNQENKGQSSARNLAINKSNTDVIIMLDADDLIETYYVEMLYNGLKAHSEAGWCYMDSVGFHKKRYLWCKTFSAGRMTFNNILVYSAAFRKSILESVGGYSGLEKHYDEDWELYLKLLSKSIRPVHIHAIGFWYRCRDNGMMNTVRHNKILRKKSNSHIKNTAKSVNLNIKEIAYCGALPEILIEVKKYSDNRYLLKLMENRFFLYTIQRIYSIIRGVS